MTSSTSSPISRGINFPISSTIVVEIDDARLQHLHATEGEELARERCRAVRGAIDQLNFSRGVHRLAAVR